MTEDDVRSLLSRLIAIPSVNPMGQPVSGPIYLETTISEFLEQWLTDLGLTVRRQPVLPGRDNILATFTPRRATRHVLFEVHQDTVPVVGMTIDPFTAVERDGRIYGRGACDNKGPMTAMMLAVRQLVRDQPADAAAVTLALTVDEEFGFTGVRKLVEQGIDVDEAIVAEPTDLDIVVAHKGAARWEITAHGKACHSSSPWDGDNAVYRMAALVSAFEEYAAEIAARPPHPLVGPPTASLGRIVGGLSVNTVPDRCVVQVERRLLPGEDADRARQELIDSIERQKRLRAPAIEQHPMWHASRPLSDEYNRPLAQRLGASIRRFRSGHQCKGVPFGTDASVLSGAGIPSVVFGPGSIAQAHTVDEWVSLAEVVTASHVLFDYLTATTDK